MLSLYVFKFLPTYAAEFEQQIDRSVARHVAQLNEGLVRLQIGIEDLANNVVRAAHDALRRHDSHPAELCIEANETRNIRFTVLKCIDVALRGLVDEVPVKDLPPALLVLERLSPGLDTMAQPIREDICEPADGGTGQGC